MASTGAPRRQIRAEYDESTITVYQAYSEEIATAAVKYQKLGASPHFSYDRMTWIKPSWSWMMYRAGYGFKDHRQTRILALRMKHPHFQELLSQASLSSHVTQGPVSSEARKKGVRVQWDPERDPALRTLPYRSIQIGISRKLSRKWAEEWIERIEDVTERAHGLKKALDNNPDVDVDTLIAQGLVPVEKPYEVSETLRQVLEMG